MSPWQKVGVVHKRPVIAHCHPSPGSLSNNITTIPTRAPDESLIWEPSTEQRVRGMLASRHQPSLYSLA